ncbi:aminodeoxychorismate lyase [Oceanisphaera sp. IT1-181]|uniref:aminodeoxychorismate lyase n=1 Tax=Oceanisphaera sp. IT1-181 TaxID=3081199 RepID=UPI0029C9EA80|nr:aminodeoxychorismate lyase [Oceanisphaera sp. IT1-181]
MKKLEGGMDSIITDTTLFSAVSRGWQLGDGHFTTVYAKHGQLHHWAYHEARLTAACARLQMPVPNWADVKARAQACLDEHSDQVLRITLVRGAGGRGYSMQGCTDTQVLLNTAPFPAQYYQWREQGITIGVCQGRLGNSPLLAGLKTVNRLEQVLLKAELDAQHWPEALVLNSQHQVVEAVTANVFWREGEVIYTPDLTELGVWGIMRAWCADYLGARLMHTQALLPRLLAADEVWLTNALMGIVPVTGIIEPHGATKFKTTHLNVAELKITRELQQAYEKIN